MKAVLAIDSFKGSLSSIEAGEAVKKGILRVYKDSEISVIPIADGGEGTTEALTKGMGGRLQSISVTGPLGDTVDAVYGIINDNLAVMEMSAAAGLTLIEENKRNPLHTTTLGVGEMIKDAIDKGIRHFIVGIGGSATNDGGAGMLQALGYDLIDETGASISSGAQGLSKLTVIRSDHILHELDDCTFRRCHHSDDLGISWDRSLPFLVEQSFRQ